MDGPSTGAATIPLAIIPVMQPRTLLPAVLCLLGLLGACADREGGDAAPATDVGAHGPRVVVGEDEPVPHWRPPDIEIPVDAVEAARAEAEAAREAGRLFGGPRDAIPLYLALRQRAPDDAEVARGFEAAVADLLDAGRAALAEPDIDFAALHRAHEIGAVARAIDPDREDVRAYLGALDQADEVAALNRAGEAELREGRLGESGGGALARFREALALAPGSARARQGIAAAESALIRRAELAAAGSDFAAATRWLELAAPIRPDMETVPDARRRVAAERAAQVRRLRDEGLAALTRDDGLADARRALDALLRIAEPGNPAAGELRQRIDLATHYGLYRPGQQFTEALRNGGRGPLMVVVPHGGFRMGAGPGDQDATDAERPQHYVRFDRGFAMARTEVTVGEFRRFVEATGHETRAQRRGFSTVYDERRGNLVRRSGVDWRHGYTGAPAADDMPVLHVSARDAEAYAAWLSTQTGAGYRLPSEAEFEYALRAGSETRYPWGDGPPPDGAGNFTGGRDTSPGGRDWRNAFPGYRDGHWGPAPTGTFTANGYGLHDLAGNVSEWVADCWHDGYRRAPVDGAAWVNPGCRTRVIRGGSWASSPAQTRSAWRLSADADTTNARLGFRVVRTL